MDIEWQETSEYRPEALPLRQFCLQNNLAWEKTAEDARFIVLVERRMLESLHDHLASDLHREHGGVLVGKPYFDPDARRHYVVIRGVIPAFDSTGSAVHLQFTPQAWDHIAGIIEESYPDQMVVGWYHSHPGLGVFMSGTDRATQSAFYAHPWNIAVVVDPLNRRSGWFLGADCQPLDGAQVIVYEDLRLEEEPLEVTVEDLPARRAPAYRWLLPLGLLLLIAGLAAWFLNRGRIDGGAV